MTITQPDIKTTFHDEKLVGGGIVFLVEMFNTSKGNYDVLIVKKRGLDNIFELPSLLCPDSLPPKLSLGKELIPYAVDKLNIDVRSLKIKSRSIVVSPYTLLGNPIKIMWATVCATIPYIKLTKDQKLVNGKELGKYLTSEDFKLFEKITEEEIPF